MSLRFFKFLALGASSLSLLSFGQDVEFSYRQTPLSGQEKYFLLAGTDTEANFAQEIMDLKDMLTLFGESYLEALTKHSRNVFGLDWARFTSDVKDFVTSKEARLGNVKPSNPMSFP